MERVPGGGALQPLLNPEPQLRPSPSARKASSSAHAPPTPQQPGPPTALGGGVMGSTTLQGHGERHTAGTSLTQAAPETPAQLGASPAGSQPSWELEGLGFRVQPSWEPAQLGASPAGSFRV